MLCLQEALCCAVSFKGGGGGTQFSLVLPSLPELRPLIFKIPGFKSCYFQSPLVFKAKYHGDLPFPGGLLGVIVCFPHRSSSAGSSSLLQIVLRVSALPPLFHVALSLHLALEFVLCVIFWVIYTVVLYPCDRVSLGSSSSPSFPPISSLYFWPEGDMFSVRN